MKHKYTFTLDTKISDKLDDVRGLISRSAYINELIRKIDDVDENKIKNDKKTQPKNISEIIVSQNQAIKTEIHRLIPALKNHHHSISEIRMFMKASLTTINNIKPGRIITLDELSKLIREEAERQGVNCID